MMFCVYLRLLRRDSLVSEVLQFFFELTDKVLQLMTLYGIQANQRFLFFPQSNMADQNSVNDYQHK